MPTRKAREIIKKQMPDMQIVEAPASGTVTAPDTDSRSLDVARLREKYLGTPYGSDAMSEVETMDESEVVYVEPKGASDRIDGPGKKAVIIKKGKIVGVQG